MESGIIYVLIDKKMKIERLKKYLGVIDIFEEVKVVDFEWLSKCLFEGNLVEIDKYILGKEDFEVVKKCDDKVLVSNIDGGK